MPLRAAWARMLAATFSSNESPLPCSAWRLRSAAMIFFPLLGQLLNAGLQFRAFLLLLPDLRLQLVLVQFLQLGLEAGPCRATPISPCRCSGRPSNSPSPWTATPERALNASRSAATAAGRGLGGELLGGDSPARRLGAIGHQRLAQFAVQLRQLAIHRRGDSDHVAGLRDGGVAALG